MRALKVTDLKDLHSKELGQENDKALLVYLLKFLSDKYPDFKPPIKKGG